MTQPPPPPPPGNYPPPQPQGTAPSSHLVLAILVTLFCCLPFGIVSIVKASQVNGLWAQGQYDAAQASSAAAKKWAIWGIIAGVIVAIIYAILMVAGVLTFDGDVSTTTEY
ncbi:CD225/dispanin family protein [Mycolicibacterium gadium]|uniref:CD225/dispanin family protein n=1 Tax=Mycolicibacterium gadium TaxID=1794 RepID=A0ABT6GLL9_MYCGU|nr:CD225/dispanin family protein [Mycolicibacterium gadium]MDG5482305.1 CD225/dispanin family protein [Mycolicibacterium gadium]